MQPTTTTIRCGEATIRLLAKYGVDTIFGIPGVHTLDFYSGLGPGSPVRHIQARHEQGAGFMADGYARSSGSPGVALVISGPGVTNAVTAIGQSWADSIPVLLLSAEPASRSLGKGWGVLHEITEQKAVTAPLTAFSATALSPADVPELIARAFTIFSSARPRPVHISIPIDVLATPVTEYWPVVALPARPRHDPALINRAARLLATASRPALIVGGGAVNASADLTAIAEQIGAIVVASAAGKGIVADDHPLSLSNTIMRPETRQWLAKADVVLAIGTELAETDLYGERLELGGALIRIDIDPHKINDQYATDVGIVADAGAAAIALREQLNSAPAASDSTATKQRVASIWSDIRAALTPSELQHQTLLRGLRLVIPDNTILCGDICQIVYTGGAIMPVRAPRLWHYPAGFCTLGCGLPNAIGAKLALPEQPVIVLVGDGGFLFTVQELVTAAELQLALPIIVWENRGYKQIQDDMRINGYPLVGVTGNNPNFPLLAQACHCHAAEPQSMDEFQQAIQQALGVDRPTVIVVHEDAGWLR